MKNHVMSLSSPPILAKARRLQLADASFRDISHFWMSSPQFFVNSVQSLSPSEGLSGLPSSHATLWHTKDLPAQEVGLGG